MTHHKLREDKQCLNCGHQVEDTYCGHCGQENVQFNDSAIHLVIHYIQDLFHYDGKLWTTVKTLLKRPGQVAIEYMEGKRRKFLDPIRFYIFTSTVFFLVLFFLVGDTVSISTTQKKDALHDRISMLKKEKEIRSGSPDTIQINALLESLKDSLALDTSAVSKDVENGVELDFLGDEQDTLEGQGWLVRYCNQRLAMKRAEYKEKYGNNELKATSAITDELLHTLPQLFFLSLPFFALFLQLLYIRSTRRKFVEHFIFSIYHYAYLFTFFLFMMLLFWGMGVTGIGIPQIITVLLILLWIFYPMIYLFLSMRRFYEDRGVTLILRYLVLLFFLMITLVVLAFVVAFLTIIF